MNMAIIVKEIENLSVWLKYYEISTINKKI